MNKINPLNEKKTNETDKLIKSVICAAIEVHKSIGSGLPEKIYEEVLCYEFENKNIKFERNIKLEAISCGIKRREERKGILVKGEMIIVVKSLSIITEIIKIQVLSYIKSIGLKRGLIINFGETMLNEGVTIIENDFQK